MIKVLEIILCMYLKTISPDVPRCGRSLHLYVLFITDQYKKKNTGQGWPYKRGGLTGGVVSPEWDNLV
jgi:hypothetical protein